jgi:hypothetical protein
MRKWALGTIAAVALCVPQASEAGGWHGGSWGWHGGWHGGTSVVIGFGAPVFGWGWGAPVFWPRPWAPVAFGAPIVVAPPVVVQSPPIVIQSAPAPVFAQQQQTQSSYWYYCPNPQGYYPYVQQCSSSWMQVVPQTPSSGPPS